MRSLPYLVLAAAAPLAAGFAPPVEPGAVVVSVPSSLLGALSSVEAAAERRLGFPILLNGGSSGALRFQLERGAEIDVFISASAEHMDRAQAAGLIDPATRMVAARNALVVIGEGRFRRAAADGGLAGLLAAAERIALGDPDSVPAGRYAAEALGDALPRDRVVLANSVRQVSAYVEGGAADLGVVYASDAAASEAATSGRVGVVYAFPDGATSSPIAYPAAVVAASARRVEATAFLDFLGDAAARSALAAAGFEVP